MTDAPAAVEAAEQEFAAAPPRPPRRGRGGNHGAAGSFSSDRAGAEAARLAARRRARRRRRSRSSCAACGAATGVGSSCRVAGLQPACAYVLRVRCTSDVGAGSWGSPVVVRTEQIGDGPLPPPFVVGKTSTTAKLGWGGLEWGDGDGWELQMDGGARITQNSDGIEAGHGGESSMGHSRQLARPGDAPRDEHGLEEERGGGGGGGGGAMGAEDGGQRRRAPHPPRRADPRRPAG